MQLIVFLMVFFLYRFDLAYTFDLIKQNLNQVIRRIQKTELFQFSLNLFSDVIVD